MLLQYFLDYPYLVYPAFDYPSIGSDNNLWYNNEVLFSYNFAQDLLIVIVTSQSSYVPRQIQNYFNERGGITFCKLLVYSVCSQKNLILDFEMAKRKRIVLSIEHCFQ